MSMKIRAMYFTGTGTTAKITTSIAYSMWSELKSAGFEKEADINFSPKAAREKSYEFDENDIVVFGVPEDNVKKMMKDTDKARANYYAYHTGRKWGEHVNYHLAMDSGYLEIEDIVDLIIQYTEKKLDRLASFNW